MKELTLAFSLVRPLPPIISEKDNLHTEDFQRWVIESTGPYAEVKVIKDSDHMVMFSKPKKLSFELLKIAYKY